ncbi:conserved protein of unknown function [Clostridium beijerinckii]|nr:conserved protein of unknown function [Clostridium beijerinckii]
MIYSVYFCLGNYKTFRILKLAISMVKRMLTCENTIKAERGVAILFYHIL